MAIVGVPAINIARDEPRARLQYDSGKYFERTIASRKFAIGFGSKRVYFEFENSRYHWSVGQPRRLLDGRESSRKIGWLGYTGFALLAFGVIFASGNMLRASVPTRQYSVVMPFPAEIVPITPGHKAHTRRPARAGIEGQRPAPAKISNAAIAEPLIEPSGAGTGQAGPDEDIETLPAKNGERAVAVYGPRRSVGGKSCRDVSLFVRGTDGKVSVSPITRCEPGR